MSTIEWKRGDILQMQPCFFAQAGPEAGMAIPSTPQASCDSCTPALTKAWASHSREQLARDLILGRGISSAESCPGHGIPSPTSRVHQLDKRSPGTLPDPRGPSQRSAWSSSGSPGSGLHPQGFCTQLGDHAAPHQLLPSPQIGQ